MRTRTPSLRRARLAAGTLAVALLAAACGGSSGGSAGTPVAKSPSFAPGTTMARLAEAGTVKVGTKFDQPLFGLKGLSGDLEGFDVEIAKIIAAKLGIPADKVQFSRDALEDPRGGDRAGHRRLRRRHLHDQRQAQGADHLRRAVLRGRAGPDGQEGRHRHHRPGVAQGRRQGLLGHRVHARRRPSRQYIDADQLVLFDVYSKCADALRTGQVVAVTTDNVILLGLVDESDGDFKLVDKPFTEGAVRHRREEGRRGVLRVHQRHPDRGCARTARTPRPGRRPRAR